MAGLDWCDLGRVAYGDARRLQEALAARRAEGALGDLLLLLEHDPVVTVGRSGAAGAPSLAVPVLRVDRGGGPTYHGPGQVVAYPVVRLAHAGRGVRRFVAALEASMVDVAATFGVAAVAREGQPGAWLAGGPPQRKIGSVGVAVRRGVSLHGAALNVARDCERGFAGFAPCGLADARVASLESAGGGRCPARSEVAAAWAQALAARLGLRACRRDGPGIGWPEDPAAGVPGAGGPGKEVAAWT